MNANLSHGPETARTPETADTPHRIALVTGANKGIGHEIARRFAALGMTVLLGSRDPRRGESAAADLRAGGGEVHPLTLDVTDQATVQAAAKHVEERFGRLDILVNNAGISGDATRQAPGSADLDVVREVFETNFFGVINVTNAMLPPLRRASGARIVNLSSSVGSLGRMTDPGHYFAQMPGFVAYPSSKTALNMLTVQYAKSLRQDGILVNAADPGHCATDFTKDVPYTTTRTAADGAAIAVRLATLGPDGPTGGYFEDAGQVPW